MYKVNFPMKSGVQPFGKQGAVVKGPIAPNKICPPPKQDGMRYIAGEKKISFNGAIF